MLTYNVGPAKLQLESQTLHLKLNDLIRALFRLNSELFVLSFLLLQGILDLKQPLMTLKHTLWFWVAVSFLKSLE